MTLTIIILVALNLCAIGLAGNRCNKRTAAEKKFWREYYGENQK